MVATVPHQHLRAPGRRTVSQQARLYINRISTSETLENVLVEEWVEVCGDSSEGQKTINAPVRVTTMAQNDETPAGQINFTFTDAAFFAVQPKPPEKKAPTGKGTET